MSSDVASEQIVVDGVPVERSIEPGTVEELREEMARIGRDRLKTLINGGRTRLAFGNAGGPYDVALSTRRLNRVIHYEPDDMTMAVEPGCTIAQLRALLAGNSQQMALDVAHPEQATIGGSYATGMSGPRRLGGGSLKDWVIGVEVAGIDGSSAKAGGMVVKNVTGFDMMHLHYGALGAFGVVTRLNLKVFPRPNAARAIRFSFPSIAAAHRGAVALLQSQLQPSSLLVSNDVGWSLHVHCDAPDTAIDRLVERVIEAVQPTGPAGSDVAEDPDTALAPFASVTDLTRDRAVARVPFTASRQATALQQLTGDDDGEVDICADPGSGLIYVAAEGTERFIERLGRLGAQPTWLSLPADLKQGRDVFGPMSQPAADVVQRLKDAFDPYRLLNPGRFVLGL